MSNPTALLGAALLSLALACGGGSSHGTDNNPPPPTATAPSITTQPQGQSVTIGQTAAFTVAASGTAPLSYQWKKGGTDIAGATSASYTTPATTSADNGASFSVTVSNSAGSVTSNGATLNVNPVAPVPGAAMTTANRTAGVAPLAVFFDCVDTVPEGIASPFTWTSGVHQPADGDYEGMTYQWNFGDSNAGAWNTTGISKNVATGYTAAHVYEAPGTYTASLSVTDKSGTVRTYQQTITIQAFSGTTYYVAASGDDANNGLDPATPFATFAKGFSMVNGGPNRSLLLRRGDSFSTAGVAITAAGPGTIGAYGTGNRPVLNTSGDAVIIIRASDWRVMDLDIVGPGLTVNNGAAIGFDVGVQTVNPLIMRVRSTQFRVGIGWGDFTPILGTPHDGAAMVDCEVATAQVNGVYVGGRRLAIMGNDIHDIVTSHVLRVWQAHKGVISNNRLWNPGPTRHALKLHSSGIGDGRPDTRYVTVSDNLIRGKTWSVSIGAQDDFSDERPTHIVVERNRFFPESSVQVDLVIHSGEVLARNNIFDATGSSTYYTGIWATHMGSVVPVEDRVRIYNNTIYRGDTCSEFAAVSVTGGVTNVTVRNNLAGPTPAGAPWIAVSGSAAGAGFVSDHNLLTATPGFTNAAAGNYSLQATSPAVDAGLSLPEVLADIFGTLRPLGSGYDLGAHESH